jgi:hypothetical protein
MKKALSVLVVLLLGTVAWAQYSPIPDGFDYLVGSRSVTIKKYTGNATFLDIPGEIDNLPVTTIDNFAFFDCSSLVSVNIPSQVTSIGAFAFWGCSSMTSVNIPSSVRSIEIFAFSSCDSLKRFIVDSHNPAFTSIDGILFDKTIQTIIAYPAAKYEEKYAIPSSVTAIGDYAFYGSNNLTNIIIPSSVTSIGDHAFFMCSSLPSITIPSSVISIGEGPFSGCSNLTNIAIDIGNPAYVSVNNILFDITMQTLIMYPNGKQAETYTFPPSVKVIEAWAFSYSSSLISVTIPSSVTTIGKGAFCGCTSLVDITIPSSVTTIDEYMFSECSSLISITIPSTVTSIGRQAFENCNNLSSITIPSSVEHIGESVFRGCDNLTRVSLSRRTFVDSRTFPSSVQFVYRD